ncbi:MAG TPA: DUF3857 domain-containing protein [Flavobacterium sp.]|uniref:DUF3857 domain-containing protein n=1 Tax=Flavobacterium sp. TaxID=239 RepID=UPI002BA7D568|nr:DUF3857 domain-containing protein [Flavobacterium sp.]HNP32126.1 DUF3857 domain-containing protein [Flavobacterium sp.]
MTRLGFIFFFVLLISFKAIGQKLELDKVTKDELLERRCPGDTSAPAAFLFKKAKTFFKYTDDKGFISVTEFQIKIKIYKKEGLAWANFKLPFYIGYEKLDDESIQIESAFTYNLENDKVTKTKVTGEGKFEEQINEYWKVKSLTFPNVKEGSIIELKYILKTENILKLPEFQFQYEIPVNNAEYITEIPELYIYKGIQKGFIEVSKEEKIESVSQSFDGKAGLVGGITSQLSYRQVKTKYTLKNVPALKEESYVNNIENYYGKIDHELQIIRMPDKAPKNVATTWEDVAKAVYEDEDFNNATHKFDYFNFDISAIIKGVSSAEEKTKKIFNYVKARMNWNKRFGYYPRQKMDKAYTDKVGNIAEINLMLVSMLRMAGVDANPVLVSTRENGFAVFPNRTLFNYVIVSADIDGKTILLDATSKNADLNVLPIRDLNWTGRLIKNDGTSTEVDLMPKTNSRKMLNMMATINENGEVSGKIRQQYFDYNAFVFRDKYNGSAKETYIEKLERQEQGLDVSAYEVQNSYDLELPVVENYDFTSNNSVEIIGDKMYVSPFIFFAETENPFKQQTREYPVDFVFPTQDKFSISLTLPQGYVVETLPQPKAISMLDNLGNFKYNISNNGNQIQLLYTRDINQAVIGPEYYEVLKNFFKEIVNKQTEKIVLKKA